MTITKKVERLFQNHDFRDIILEEFINKSVNYFVLNNDVGSVVVQEELKARKILNDYLQYCLEFDTIESLQK